MNTTTFTTSTYEEIGPFGHPKNEPNSNPISKMAKMNANSDLTKTYKNNAPFTVRENKVERVEGYELKSALIRINSCRLAAL